MINIFLYGTTLTGGGIADAIKHFSSENTPLLE
jgi:hypothetical protein